MDNSSLLKIALTRSSEGNRETWCRTAEKERMVMGYCSCAELGLAVDDRASRRSKILEPLSIWRGGTGDDRSTITYHNWRHICEISSAEKPQHASSISRTLHHSVRN